MHIPHATPPSWQWSSSIKKAYIDLFCALEPNETKVSEASQTGGSGASPIARFHYGK
jgi:hypothetical protein